jgi:hypothetical protein
VGHTGPVTGILYSKQRENHMAVFNINSRLFPALLKLIAGVKRWVNVVFPGICRLVVLHVSEEPPASFFMVSAWGITLEVTGIGGSP